MVEFLFYSLDCTHIILVKNLHAKYIIIIIIIIIKDLFFVVKNKI